jgi:4-hydroxy-3-polyprenylbenzoate decarboxylase
MKRYILAITGSSGSLLGLRLLEELAKNSEVHLIVSEAALLVIGSETSIELTKKPDDWIIAKFPPNRVFLYKDSNIGAPLASGSFVTNGMFIVPCSMKTLSAVANGYASNLIERAADVTIKEGRKLLICPREMPFSAIHLENMLKLARLGVITAPPVPAFYNKPQTIDDMINFLIGKILDCFGIENRLYKRWRGDD